MPLQAFAYLDIDNPVVAWGAYRGVLISAQAAAIPPNCPVSLMFAGMIQHQNIVHLENELLIEAARTSHFPHQISRLAGMYFFTDLEQAKKAEFWGGYFRSENLAQ